MANKQFVRVFDRKLLSSKACKIINIMANDCVTRIALSPRHSSEKERPCPRPLRLATAPTLARRLRALYNHCLANPPGAFEISIKIQEGYPRAVLFECSLDFLIGSSNIYSFEPLMLASFDRTLTFKSIH